jgi:hypothetical protein
MAGREQLQRPWWLRLTVAVALVLFIAAAYLLAMRLTIDVSRISDARDAAHRDNVYLVLHASAVLIAAVAGAVAGWWVARASVAYAVLALVALAIIIIGAHAGSQVLACEAGHNDLIRHWSCD